MIHRSFHCPSCDELGFLSAESDADTGELVDAVCHYCGHVVTAEEIAEEQAFAASRLARAPRR
jgi:transcription elongation factor Elf1